MPTTVRSTNLDLIRWLNAGHNNAAKKLAAVTNANYLSKMATGEMEVGDYEARRIEGVLDLPTGWMDRDNVAMLAMSSDAFDLQQQISRLPDDAKISLRQFLIAISTAEKDGESR